MNNYAGHTIDLLKQAMKQKGDFPAVSSAMERILQAMKDNTCSDEQMATLVLSDFALTQKVLRLANSPMYAAFSPVTTVSMAIYVLGNETVGHVALGMKLLDNLGKAADSKIAQQELAKTVIAGAIARKVGASVSALDGEPLAVATLIRGLGQLLVCFYLPEQFASIKEQSNSFDEEASAAQTVLGLPYEELALRVAESWSFPNALKACVEDPPKDADSHASWLASVTGYARRYIAAVANGGSEKELRVLADRYAEHIGASPQDLLTQAETAMTAALDDCAGDLPDFMVNVRRKVDTEPLSAAQYMKDGIAQIEAVKGGMKPGQILGMATEILWKGLGCSKFLLFLRNKQTLTFDLALGRGEGVADLVRKLKFEEAFSPNVFHFALTKNTSIFLTDAHDPTISKRIPQWLKDTLPPAQSIFLMPFAVKGSPAGIIYLDWGDNRREGFTEEEQALIEKLRAVVGNALSSALTNAPSG